MNCIWNRLWIEFLLPSCQLLQQLICGSWKAGLALEKIKRARSSKNLNLMYSVRSVLQQRTCFLALFWDTLSVVSILCPNVPINAVEVPIATPLAIVISLLKAVVSASTQQTKLLAFPFREESFCILHGYKPDCSRLQLGCISRKDVRYYNHWPRLATIQKICILRAR